jgi:hydroxymethylpyrimidine/phosphomethylpyrimidine kinase
MTQPVALTIAGSDPSGGAGVQADLKVFQQYKVYGTAVISLLTVQNTKNVYQVKALAADFVKAQLDAVLDDIPPLAAKTGALGSREVIEAISQMAEYFTFPLVVDPVLISKHGARLLEPSAEVSLKDKLLPWAFLLTPNIPEAEAISGVKIRGIDEITRAAEKIINLGAKHVLIKGGHLEEHACDYLFFPKGVEEFPGNKLATKNTHGTGCSFSAAITAGLASGLKLSTAVGVAKTFIFKAILNNPELGSGYGPTNLLVEPDLYIAKE